MSTGNPFDGAASAQALPATAAQPPARNALADAPAVPSAAGASPGNEHVADDAASLPQIKLLQAMTPEAQPGNDAYVQGAIAGMFIETVDNALLGEPALVLNVFFRVRYNVWSAGERQLLGSFVERADAEALVAQHPAGQAESTFTGEHFLVALIDGKLKGPYMFAMSRSKTGMSRQWNSMIQTAHSHRYAKWWRLTSETRVNNGNMFHVPVVAEAVAGAGWATPEHFAQAGAIAEQALAEEQSARAAKNRPTPVSGEVLPASRTAAPGGGAPQQAPTREADPLVGMDSDDIPW